MCSQKIPFISVILNCFNRRDYLYDALLGLSNQSADKEIFEVVLITDFVDNTIMDILSGFHFYKLVLETTPILGDRLISGIKVATGEIIVLHDDDDIFLPEKVIEVFNVFQSDEQIAYYHNNFKISSLCSTNTRISHRVGHSKNQTKHSFCLKISDLSVETFRELISNNCDFNASCIAIRRSILNCDLLSGLSALEDTTFFVMGLISNHKIYVSSNILTIYRIHSTNNSIGKEKMFKDIYAKKSKFSNRQKSAILQIKKSINSYNLQNYLYSKIDNYLNLEMLPALIFSNQNSKWDMIILFYRFLKGERILELKTIAFLFLMAFIYISSKKLFYALYFIRQ